MRNTDAKRAAPALPDVLHGGNRLALNIENLNRGTLQANPSVSQLQTGTSEKEGTSNFFFKTCE